MIMNKEVRSYNDDDVLVEVRKEGDVETRTVQGYALVFDKLSHDLGGFKEKIDRQALEGVLEKSDVLCLLNHDERRGLLARYDRGRGSLTLEVDERGLKYTFEAPHTALGDELLEGLKRKDITKSSFAFSVEVDEWVQQADKTYIRTIKKIKRLYDVSPVYTPAYNDTSVAKRNLSDNNEYISSDYYDNLLKQTK